MKSGIFKLIIFIAFVGSTTGCLLGTDKTSYGGSQTYQPPYNSASDENYAQALLASAANLFIFDAKSASIGSNPNVITNQKPNPLFLSLTPGASGLVQWTADGLTLNADITGQGFSSPMDVDLVTDSATIFLTFNSAARGTLLSLNPFDRINQAFEISATNSEIRADFLSSPTDVSSVTTAQVSTPTTLLAVIFKSDASIELYLNGVKATAASVVGNVTPPFTLSRLISLGPINASETLPIKSAYVFNRALSGPEVGSILRHLISRYELSGVTLDPSLGTAPDSGGSGPNLYPQVRSIIQSQCLSCHASWGGVGASYFASAGLVVPKNPAASKFYYRLTGSTGAGGPKNMPQSGSPLSAESLETVKSWIQSL